MSSASLHSLDLKQLSRLGIDPANGPRAMSFLAPLLDQMRFPHVPQGIIAQYLLDDRYDSIFARAAQDLMYVFVYDQCSTDHRILNYIVWHPASSDQSASSKREKVKDLAFIIRSLITPKDSFQIPQARLERFAPLDLGSLAEQFVLYWVKCDARKKIPRYREHPHLAPSLSKPILITQELVIHASSGNTWLRDKKKIIDLLYRRVVNFALMNPDVPLDELPYPQEVPKELSDIPTDELYVPPPDPLFGNLVALANAVFAPIQVPQLNAPAQLVPPIAPPDQPVDPQPQAREELEARVKEADEALAAQKKRTDDAIAAMNEVHRANPSATAASAVLTPTEQTASPNTISTAQPTPISVPTTPQPEVPSIANLIEPKPTPADILKREAEEQSALVRKLEIDEKLRKADVAVQEARERTQKADAAVAALQNPPLPAVTPNPQPPAQPSLQKWVFEFVREYKGSITSVALSSLAALCAFGAVAGAVAGVATAVLFASVQWIRARN